MNGRFLGYLSFPLDRFNYEQVDTKIKELEENGESVYMYRVVSFRLEEEGAIFYTEKDLRAIEALKWYEEQRDGEIT